MKLGEVGFVPKWGCLTWRDWWKVGRMGVIGDHCYDWEGIQAFGKNTG